MDFYQKYSRQITKYALVVTIVAGLVPIALVWTLGASLDRNLGFALLAISSALSLSLAALSTSHYAQIPMQAIWRVVQFIAPHNTEVTAPKIDAIKVGQEMVANMANKMYQFASVVDDVEKSSSKHKDDIHTDFVANALPLPLIVLDKQEIITYINASGPSYFKSQGGEELVGKHINTAFELAFSGNETLDDWLKGKKKSTITADTRWERVRIGLPGQDNTKLFDMAAHYNKANPHGYETLLVLFDHSKAYGQDDQALSFVALTVHELRTPLTLLRGYIELFNEEIGPTLDDEMRGFMQKMDASGQQLAGFVDNILNVTKIEDNQLELQLKEENWNDVLDHVIDDLSLRTKVRGITIKTDIDSNLPTVAVDRYSIYEVLSNLIDNAVKYSGTSKEVFIGARINREGMVETSVKDFGLGIDGAVLPHIFEKFYRNHRNRAQIGGTGLGLYLSHAIVDAHHGQMSVQSKVDQGSTFRFTVQPYATLATELKAEGDNGTISRSAHGWIKNHSYYKQ
ncbi:MAG: ATP-binding protein [Candidatus Saccharimonadales bacterium]